MFKIKPVLCMLAPLSVFLCKASIGPLLHQLNYCQVLPSLNKVDTVHTYIVIKVAQLFFHCRRHYGMTCLLVD